MAINILDPIGSLKAEIQAKVGEFLQLKAKLLPYTTSTDPATNQVANSYMARQVSLEGQLPTMLTIANNVGTSNIFSTDTVNLTAFGSTMNRHIGDVNAFLGPASVQAMTMDLLPGLGITQTQFLIGMGAIVAGIVLGKPLYGIAAAGAGYAYAKGVFTT